MNSHTEMASRSKEPNLKVELQAPMTKKSLGKFAWCQIFVMVSAIIFEIASTNIKFEPNEMQNI